jgi:hypothetical protein
MPLHVGNLDTPSEAAASELPPFGSVTSGREGVVSGIKGCRQLHKPVLPALPVALFVFRLLEAGTRGLPAVNM